MGLQQLAPLAELTGGAVSKCVYVYVRGVRVCVCVCVCVTLRACVGV